MLREIFLWFEDLVVIKEFVKKELEIICYFLKYFDRLVLFEDVEGWKVVGNIWSIWKRIVIYFNIMREEFIYLIVEVMENLRQYKEVKEVFFFKNLMKDFFFKKFLILKYYLRDGGQYFILVMVIVKDDNGFVNVFFYRMMVCDEKIVVIRFVLRYFYVMWKEKVENGEDFDVRIVVGNLVYFFLVGFVSIVYGVSELEIVLVMSEIVFGKLFEVIEFGGILVLIESEFVFEVRIMLEFVDEGLFVDIIGMYDIVRRQLLVVFEKMYYVDDFIFYVLFFGGYEYYMLMGFLKELQIYVSVKRVVLKVYGVRLIEGGVMWFYVVVLIIKQYDGDGKNVILVVFVGYLSLKRVIVVDEDINIYDDREVEWVVVICFQLDRDLVIVLNVRGSLFDFLVEKGFMVKWGIDVMKFLGRKEEFERVRV